MNTSMPFDPATNHTNSPAFAPQRSHDTSMQMASSAQILTISLPAFEFYQLGMGSANLQLPVAETTVINEITIPRGSIATIHFEYMGLRSNSRKGDINLLMMNLVSVDVNGQVHHFQSNTVSLGEFADPQNPPIVFISTTTRLEVPVETTILFEVQQPTPMS